MSDRNERACTNCSSLLHHEDDCPQPLSPQSSVGVEEILRKSFDKNVRKKFGYAVGEFDTAKQDGGYDWIYEAMTEYSSLMNKEKDREIERINKQFYIVEQRTKTLSKRIDELQQLLSEKEKETEELKALIKSAHYAGWYNGMVNAYKHEFSWDEFCKNNSIKNEK